MTDEDYEKKSFLQEIKSLILRIDKRNSNYQWNFCPGCKGLDIE
ncbi:hypothetical protein SDC9_60236 [bioreactor metagenome]|uniref:Uncharacterized protein n=1 Tax=bioreactor metagenome TaxID=1076179 RepID=A0A644XCC3_9ZZZZ